MGLGLARNVPEFCGDRPRGCVLGIPPRGARRKLEQRGVERSFRGSARGHPVPPLGQQRFSACAFPLSLTAQWSQAKGRPSRRARPAAGCGGSRPSPRVFACGFSRSPRGKVPGERSYYLSHNTAYSPASSASFISLSLVTGRAPRLFAAAAAKASAKDMG